MSDLVIPVDAGKLPAYLSKPGVDAGAGRLADESGIVNPPRIKLLQNMSPEVVDNLGKVGEWWSEAHSACAGGEAMVIPLRWETEWMEFTSDDERAAGETRVVKWRSNDPNSPEVLAKGADAWKFKRLNCLVLGPISDGGQLKPQVLTFHGQSMGAGKGMYVSCVRSAVGAPMQAQVWKLGAEDKPGKTPKQKVKAITARFAGLASEELYTAAVSAYKEFADRVISPEVEETADSNPSQGKKAAEVEDDLPF